MYKTLQQLLVDTQKAVYQAAGAGVQVYSQDVILQQLQQAFNHIFLEEWWPQFRVRETRVLDGVNGYTTVPLSYIKTYEDIRWVFAGTEERPLPVLPMEANLSDSGTHPRFIEGDVNNIFRVWPQTAVGNVMVVGRARPDPYILTDVVKMDPTLLVHFAAWSYFTDDGSNPEAALKHKTLFELRYKQLKDSSFNEPVVLDPFADQIPDRWRPY